MAIATVRIRDAQQRFCSVTIDATKSVGDAAQLAALSAPPALQQCLQNCAFYLSGRVVRGSTVLQEIVGHAAEVDLLAIARKAKTPAPGLAAGKGGAALASKPNARCKDAAARSFEDTSRLVYGRDTYELDTLLPGYVSRPHVSPDKRLSQQRLQRGAAAASPLQHNAACATGAPDPAPLHGGASVKRRLSFGDTGIAEPQGTESLCTDQCAEREPADLRTPRVVVNARDHALRAYGEIADATHEHERAAMAPPLQPRLINSKQKQPPTASSLYLTSLQAELQSGALLNAPAHDELADPALDAEQPQPQHNASPTPQGPRLAAVQALFAPRQAAAAEEALAALPLPPAVEDLARIFTALNRLDVWLRVRHIETTWRTVQDVLADLFAADAFEVTPGHLECLAAIFPLGVSLGRAAVGVASFAEREGKRAVPDAAAVATGADAEREGTHKVPDAAAVAAGAAEEQSAATDIPAHAAAAPPGPQEEGDTPSAPGEVVACGRAHPSATAVSATNHHTESASKMQTAPPLGEDFAIRLHDPPRHVASPEATPDRAKPAAKGRRRSHAAGNASGSAAECRAAQNHDGMESPQQQNAALDGGHGGSEAADLTEPAPARQTRSGRKPAKGEPVPAQHAVAVLRRRRRRGSKSDADGIVPDTVSSSAGTGADLAAASEANQAAAVEAASRKAATRAVDEPEAAALETASNSDAAAAVRSLQPAAGSLAAKREAVFRRSVAQAVALLQLSWARCVAGQSAPDATSADQDAWRDQRVMEHALASVWPEAAGQGTAMAAPRGQGGAEGHNEAPRPAVAPSGSAQHSEASTSSAELPQAPAGTVQAAVTIGGAPGSAPPLRTGSCVPASARLGDWATAQEEWAAQVQASKAGAQLRWQEQFPVDAVQLADVEAAAAVLFSRWAQSIDGLPDAKADAMLCQLHTYRRAAPCTDTTRMPPEAFLEHLKTLGFYRGQLVHVERMPARRARHAAPAAALCPQVRAALAARGVAPDRLYLHQAAAVDSLLARRHTVVCTSTASGKSLCYTIPILQTLAEDPGACALFLFPTKALAQDQRAALAAAAAAALGAAAPPIDVYDGDTPASERPLVRARARLLITNPDMLHVSVLPFHRTFAPFLRGLRYVVVDEGHMYKGAFGCHVASVARRLRRVCEREHGTAPTFVVTSATSADPARHVRDLLGVDDVRVITEDGSPHAPRLFAMWNPPLSAPNAERGGGAVATGGRVEYSHTEGRKRAPIEKRKRERARRDALQQGGAAAAAAGEGASTAVSRKRSRAAGAAATAGGAAAAAGGPALQAACSAVSAPEATAGARVGDAPPSDEQHAASERAAGKREEVAAGCADAVTAESQPPRKSSAAQARRKREVDAMLCAVDPNAKPASLRRGVVRPGARGAGGAAVADTDSAEISARLDVAAGEQHEANKAGRAPQRGYVRPEAKRRSPILEISLLLAECIQHGLRTIAFCKTRKVCELVTSYTREVLKETAPQLVGGLAVYRSGYSPAERRAIERALHSGALVGVAATNALELGIDIGGLDVTLHLSFPGSVASLWQQAGRAGRREQTSLSIYVAFDGPLDQFYMRQPAALFARDVETPRVNPGNMVLLQQHLACAAAELPVVPALDARYFGAALSPAIEALHRQQTLGPLPSDHGAYGYIGGAEVPARGVSLRTIDPDVFKIVNTASGDVIEQIEQCKAFWEVYDGAIYMFQGRPFLCRKVDLGARIAEVAPCNARYYTKPVHATDVHVVGGQVAYVQGRAAAVQHAGTSARCGAAVVTTRYTGFVRIWRGSGISFDHVRLFLPDVQFGTEAFYVRIPKAARRSCEAEELPYSEGVHAAAHALINVLPALVACNVEDLQAECGAADGTRYRPERLLLYDAHPGGIGISAQAAPLLPALAARARDLVAGCACAEASGCPSCVHFVSCNGYNAMLNKHAALVILEHVLEQEGALAGARGEKGPAMGGAG